MVILVINGDFCLISGQIRHSFHWATRSAKNDLWLLTAKTTQGKHAMFKSELAGLSPRLREVAL